MNRADAVLSRANPNIDLLVLPELAFSGEYKEGSFSFLHAFLEYFLFSLKGSN
jgi:hypothetical protein